MHSVQSARQEAVPNLSPIGLLTCAGKDDDKDDDLAIIKVFKSMGIHAEFIVWDQPRDLRDYKAIIVRSTWGYHKNIIPYIKTLQKIASLGIPLINPLNTLLWNLDKKYLREVDEKFTIETEWISKSDLQHLDEILKRKNWTDCVIKPTISAEGDHTFRFSIEDADDVMKKCQQASVDSWMLQPFLKEIQEEGEWSLVLVEGKCIHAVLKKPATGHFLVQEIHGGSSLPEVPPNWMIEQAEKILSNFKHDIFYARIDLVNRSSRNVAVMEVEVIEPYLFFPEDPKHAAKLATTFVKAAVNRLMTFKTSAL